MRENRYSLTRILPYMNGIYDSILMQENMAQLKHLVLYILRSVLFEISFWDFDKIRSLKDFLALVRTLI